VFRANFTDVAIGDSVSSFCTGCGNSMAQGERFCRACGRDSAAPAPTVPPAQFGATPVSGEPAETSGKAIISLICGLFFFFFPASIVAIIFGHLSLSEIKKSAGRLGGQGLAVAGLVLGYAGVAIIPVVLIIAAIAIPNLLKARMAANEASAVANVHALVSAEINFASNHAQAGFTCSLSDLSGEQLISSDLAEGKKNGYAFALANCTPGGPNIKFQIVAYPEKPNQSGVRAFCSDESGVIKVDSGGSTQACLENGTVLQ
jgi:type IV pilus assembly protein PilA